MALSGVSSIVMSFPPMSTGIPAWAVVLNVLIGLAMFAVAWGLFTLQSWAWVVTIGIQIINGLFAFIALLSSPRMPAAWIALAISAVVLIYMTRPRVRFAFASARGPSTPPPLDQSGL